MLGFPDAVGRARPGLEIRDGRVWLRPLWNTGEWISAVAAAAGVGWGGGGGQFEIHVKIAEFSMKGGKARGP